MFQRKVHPEYSTGEKGNGMQADEAKKKTAETCHNNGNHVFQDEDIVIYPKRSLSKKNIRHFKSPFNHPHFAYAGNESENKELWIKTDADCKYPLYPMGKNYPKLLACST